MQTIRFMVGLLIVSLWMTGIAQAGMVNTGQVTTSQKAQPERDKLNIILQRSDVVAQLKQLGVDQKQAQERANSLTDQEVLAMANRIDQLPIGGNEDPGDILGAALLIFIILIITDILGYTDIFPFIHHTSQ